MNHPVYALPYGLGIATGTFLGITIEQHLAFVIQLMERQLCIEPRRSMRAQPRFQDSARRRMDIQ